MSDDCKQTYLRTRVRIFARRLFKPEDLSRLMQTPMEELAQRFALQSFLEGGADLKQGSHILERALLRLLMLEFSILLRPLNNQARELLLHWSRKFELYNLKTLIRGKLNGLDIETIRDDLYDLPESIRLPHERLLGAESVNEMLRLLEGGSYASIARQARQVYEELNEPFSLDAAIDRLYYAGLLKVVEQACPGDQAGVRRLVACLIDRQNILWLLRYRYAYGFAPSKAYYLLIPAGGGIKRARLMQLANLESFEALIGNLPNHFSRLLAGAVNSMQVRQRLDRHVSEEARWLLRVSPSAVTAALSYLVAREKDLRLVFAIIQGHLLELEAPVIAEALGAAPAVGEAAS
jgi:V/A-type H+-transporting ATPase subunit C